MFDQLLICCRCQKQPLYLYLSLPQGASSGPPVTCSVSGCLVEFFRAELRHRVYFGCLFMSVSIFIHVTDVESH